MEEELAQLPEKFRMPLVECQIMGRRHNAVARELGCSLRTLTLRLEQGRDLLQKRLAARGVTVPASC
jgi:DNA-directed RNA polymerase specialized sigma24 family protein